MRELYTSIMDAEKNPLRHLPPAQRFQAMVLLSTMWTVVFCTVAGLWFWFGELLLGHVLLALGTVVTGFTFRGAERRRSCRDHPAGDGTARYDDVWGG